MINLTEFVDAISFSAIENLTQGGEGARDDTIGI